MSSSIGRQIFLYILKEVFSFQLNEHSQGCLFDCGAPFSYSYIGTNDQVRWLKFALGRAVPVGNRVPKSCTNGKMRHQELSQWEDERCQGLSQSEDNGRKNS